MFHALQLSKTDPTPLYIQLATGMAQLIQAGLLPVGIKLPPIRTLSKQLSINRDTVVSAYKLLENQGLVEAFVGKGTYVAQTYPPSLPDTSSFESNNIYCSTLGFSKDLFPATLCKQLADTVITTEGWSAFCDPLYRERNILKQSACSFLENAGVKATSAQLRIIKNYPSLLLTLFKHSSKQGICVEEYCDLTYVAYLRSVGAKIYEVPLSSEGMNLDVLEKYLRAGNIGYILLSTYLQNPTGICYSFSTKHKLIKLAETYDCYIIEDGTLSEFSYDNTPLLPLFNHFSKDRVIYIYHFSKVYLPYLSYSFALLPSHMLKYIPDLLECTFNEYFLRYYLTSHFLAESKEEMLSSCKEKYIRLREGLSLFEGRIKVYAVCGGLFFWLKPLTVPCDEICRFFIQHNIVVAPGSLFTPRNKSDYFRLSIPQLTTFHINDILNILQQKI